MAARTTAIGSIAQLLCSPPHAREGAAAARSYARQLDAQFTAFDARFDGKALGGAQDEPPPVFVLSAGWRSGSTLLQRMVMAHNRDIIIWGEPYAQASPVAALSDQFRPFSESWPDPAFFLEQHSDDLAKEWVANLYPPPASFRAAHLSFMNTLFARPAHEMGRRQWGLKEVRFGADEVRYLRWLYPRAKFLFLVRDPAAAYRSYRRSRSWFARWPNRMVSNPYDFGAHWARLSHDFRQMSAAGIGPLVRYEALSEAAVVETLQGHLGWEVPPARSVEQVTGMNGARAERLSWLEHRLLRRGLGTAGRELGYD